MNYDVAIIGGGLAGAGAAIHLATQGRSVLLLEKRPRPAHKLCGEFLSVEVGAQLERLGVLEAARAAGAHPIRRLRLTSVDGADFQSALPGTALGLSRRRLDALLLERARAVGVEVREGTTVRGVAGRLPEGFVVETRAASCAARVVLGAYGRRALLDRRLARPFLQRPSPFVAFKAHFEGLDLPHTIELHAFPGGYCGLSHVEAGRINGCWIAHERTLKAAGGDPEAMIEQSLRQNPALAARFDGLRRVTDPFVAVSQVLFTPKGTFERDVCMVGDAAGMIAPMCGDGMAMALRSAELAAPLAGAFLDDHLDPEGFRHAYDRAWRAEFGLRMRLGRWMHHAYIRPLVAYLGVRACRTAPPLGRWMIRKTRG